MMGPFQMLSDALFTVFTDLLKPIGYLMHLQI